MSINWITAKLGTAPFGQDDLSADYACIDIRAMVDKGGNGPAILQGYVRKALLELEQGRVVVICCDHGISRSNSIAAAVLSRYEKISISEAIRLVLAATNNAEMRLEVLDAIRLEFDEIKPHKDESKNERWLLTGASGYLGSALAATAPGNIDLVCPSHTELDLSMGSPVIDLFVREHQVSRILHFAIPPVGNTNSSFGETLVALRNVLDACVSNALPIMLPSRWEVFAGYKGADLDADELTLLKPAGVLGDSKYFSEKLVETYIERAGIRALILRSGLVYGGASAPNFVRSFLHRAMKGEEVSTHLYANGEPKLDLLHIDDWIRAAWILLLNDLQGVFHCGSGSVTGTSEIAKMVAGAAGIAGNEAGIRQIDILDGFANVALDSSKLKAVGWEAKVDPRNGIPAFAAAYINR